MAGKEMSGTGLLPVFFWTGRVIEVGAHAFLKEVL